MLANLRKTEGTLKQQGTNTTIGETWINENRYDFTGNTFAETNDMLPKFSDNNSTC